jgi:5-methylcytosine-specific restriction protein B
MVGTSANLELLAELKSLVERGLAAGDLMTSEQISGNLQVFERRFGPSLLMQVDGEALLSLMHGRLGSDSKCLMYWLEFKNDEEFLGKRFGLISGGSSLNFGVFQRPADGAWVTGSPTTKRVISVSEAIEIARGQRDQLVRGAQVLGRTDVSDTSDETYADLQLKMERAAPGLAGTAWAHKYWFLLYSDRLVDFHVPQYQRFHLIKLRQLPPDRAGIVVGNAPRFICAGRYISIARALGVHVSTLSRSLSLRNGSLHAYWRVGTTEGEGGNSQWPAMREGDYAALGWAQAVPDLSPFLSEERAILKRRVRDYLSPGASNLGVVARKAGEICNFAVEMAENDIVLACQGLNVLGVGRVSGPYQYEWGLAFPHKRPVEWLSIEDWVMPVSEGPRTTVYRLGRSAENLLEAEQRLRRSVRRSRRTVPSWRTEIIAEVTPLSPLDSLSARVESILQRKGQVILYGPPGTGKTYQALRIARELAARRAFSKSFDALSDTDRTLVGPNGLVRLCTFHPSYGYEDFVEGLRPRVAAGGQMIFEPRSGIFKQLCTEASAQPSRHFILVIDEINRGDLPRIFGELLTLMERDKRGLPVTLPNTQTSFVVPANVFLIGTMNTADRSISLLDAALRRRFGFIELMPDGAHLGTRRVGNLKLGPWLDALNARLRRSLRRNSRNLQVGHAYLAPPAVLSVTDFVRVLRDEIIPLLEEYCYDDFQALQEILGPEIVDVERARIREEIFDENRQDELIEAVLFYESEDDALATDVVDDNLEQQPDEE